MAAAYSNEVEAVIQKWQDDFTQPINNETQKQAFLACYHPNIVWTDHAFHVQRHGHEAVFGLYKSFNHCNQPFHTKIKALHHTSRGAVLEGVWVGRCVNDIVRPDGEVVVKAHGKSFNSHVCFVIEVGEDGLIRKIDEYYTRIWEDGISVDDYKQIDGPSMR